MRTLILFRHGKSDWDAEFENDHERPLAKRGRKAAARMGRYLIDGGLDPDRIIASTAVRASRTADHAIEKGGWTGELVRSNALYHAGPEELLDIVKAEGRDASTLVLVGHEPTMSSAIARFAGLKGVEFPTAAMARIDFSIDSWSEAAWGAGNLVWLVQPRSLED